VGFFIRADHAGEAGALADAYAHSKWHAVRGSWGTGRRVGGTLGGPCTSKSRRSFVWVRVRGACCHSAHSSAARFSPRRRSRRPIGKRGRGRTVRCHLPRRPRRRRPGGGPSSFSSGCGGDAKGRPAGLPRAVAAVAHSQQGNQPASCVRSTRPAHAPRVRHVNGPFTEGFIRARSWLACLRAAPRPRAARSTERCGCTARRTFSWPDSPTRSSSRWCCHRCTSGPVRGRGKRARARPTGCALHRTAAHGRRNAASSNRRPQAQTPRC
jgi:hypothetical protein